MIRIECNDGKTFITEDISIDEFYTLPINRYGFMTLPSGALININNVAIIYECKERY